MRRQSRTTPGWRGAGIIELRPATSPPRAARRILLAEDDAAMRELVASVLRRDGFDVVEAATGADLLAELADTFVDGSPPSFELIISDVRLPLVTGIEVLAGLRDIGCDVPFIIMTAFADDAIYAEASRLRATRVFDKPFQLAELRQAVRDRLSPDRGRRG